MNSFEALSAEKLNANRIELCKSLNLDGLTPDIIEVKKSLDLLSIPLKVMIRCRPGNFIYNNSEVEKMLEDIKLIKKIGVKEIVFGALTKEKKIDIDLINKIVQKSIPMKTTFHKAIDKTENISNELEKLYGIHAIKSILTSGGEKTAVEGSKKIKELIKKHGKRFNFIVAGSVKKDNLIKIHEKIRANEYHGRDIIGTL